MKKLSETWRKRIEVIYHALLILISLFLCFVLGIIAYQGIGSERVTWALSTVSGMFGMVLIFYFTAGVEKGIKKLRGK